MKKRKIILTILLLILISIGGVLVWKIYSKAQHKAKQEAMTAQLPDFSFKTLEGEIFTKLNLTPNQNRVLVFFNPLCEHCQYEAKTIHQHVKELAHTEVLWVSPNEKKAVQAFAQEYGLDTLANTRVLLDQQLQVDNIFGTKNFPEIWIYNTEGKLVKRYRGETKWEAVIQQLIQSS